MDEEPQKSRAAAKAAGSKRYFTGKPCKYGHIAPRLSSNGTCFSCASIAAAKWHKDNPEKANAEASRWRKKNPGKAAEAYAKWRSRNLGSLAAAQAKRAKNNPRAVAAASAKWVKNNPEKHCANTAKRRATKLQATPAWADPLAIKFIYAQAAKIGAHVDHIVPLRNKLVCGLHCEHNLQPLAPVENARKGNRYWPGMPSERTQA